MFNLCNFHLCFSQLSQQTQEPLGFHLLQIRFDVLHCSNLVYFHDRNMSIGNILYLASSIFIALKKEDC